jgi:hypothetical protein
MVIGANADHIQHSYLGLLEVDIEVVDGKDLVEGEGPRQLGSVPIVGALLQVAIVTRELLFDISEHLWKGSSCTECSQKRSRGGCPVLIWIFWISLF